MTGTVTGGCQCGKVRYTATIEDHDAYLCHCRMCQRATGGVSIAFKNLPKANIRWDSDPDWYESSPVARRPFCAQCGTPLGFEYPDSDHADLTVGSFDDPTPYSPTHHFGAESMHEAWLDTGELKRMRTTDYEPLVKRWKEKVGKVPD